MTEREYVLEMLCCTPIELLKKKQEGKIDEIPRWLIKYSTAIVEEAILKYYEPQYEKKRAEMLKQI